MRSVRNKTMKMIALFVCMIMTTLILQPATGAKAATSRLSARSTKVWVNTSQTIYFTLKDRKSSDKITVTPKNKKLVEVNIGKWSGNTVAVTFKALGDGSTKATVKCGGEKLTLKLSVRKNAKMTSEEAYKYLYDATVVVKTWDSMGEVYIGTGFFVGNGELLTNNHIVAAASKITITDFYGKTYKIKGIYARDTEKNLILFKTAGGNRGALSLADAIVAGQRMYSFGNPAGVIATFSTGIVTNPDRELDGNYYFQSSMPAGIGSGGGPMVDEYGRVIGIMTLSVTAAQNMNFGMKFDVIAEFLKEAPTTTKMTLESLYKQNAGQTKESNDYGIFSGQGKVEGSGVVELNSKEYTSEEMYEMAHDALVDVYVYFVDGSGSSGSGFFIEDNKIVSCAHVFDHGRIDMIQIVDYNGNVYIGSDLRMNTRYDVASVKTRVQEGDGKHSVLECAYNYHPEGGETVYAYGSPAGYSATLSEGVTIFSEISLSSYESSGLGVSSDLKFIAFSSPIFSGSSGGVLLNKYGQAIGITSGILNVTQNLNMAVQIAQIDKIK